MRTKFIYLLSFIVFVNLLSTSLDVYSQTEYKAETYTYSLNMEFSPSNVGVDWFAHLQNMDTIYEGNRTYQSYLSQLKSKIDTYHYSMTPSTFKSNRRVQQLKTDTPMVSYAFEGNQYNGSVPNDNTMAISNDGIVVAAINTNVIFYDTKSDSLLKTVSLVKFSDTLTTVSKHQYDPKAIYDYKEDRFILVFLAGSKSSETDIIVAFSQTSDPMGDWNIYSLPGNPLNDTSWTDYPAISLSNDELFITGNLLKDNGSWQTSFKQSVVWQIDKYDGFQGDSLDTKLYHDIKHKGVNVRNIHPVRGGNAFYGPEVYLLSNLNFTLESDTFFFIKISDLLSSTSANLSVDLLKSDVQYGMPPNATQTIPKPLATNDARVLGAFYQNDEIQFVGNSIRIYVDSNSVTNKLASFYHGVIKEPSSTPILHLNIFSNDSLPMLEFGYPNISYCGTNEKSQHSLITYNTVSENTMPAFAASFFEKDDTYSASKELKGGETTIDILWSTQRWGDYSASQPKYDEPGKVWASGTFGKKAWGRNAYGTWISEIYSSVEDIPYNPIPADFSAKVYPNPPQDQQMFISFNLTTDQIIQIDVVDINGRSVAQLYDANAKAGKNVFSFSTTPLENGLYVVRIMSGDKMLYSQKITVIQ